MFIVRKCGWLGCGSNQCCCFVCNQIINVLFVSLDLSSLSGRPAGWHGYGRGQGSTGDS